MREAGVEMPKKRKPSLKVRENLQFQELYLPLSYYYPRKASYLPNSEKFYSKVQAKNNNNKSKLLN